MRRQILFAVSFGLACACAAEGEVRPAESADDAAVRLVADQAFRAAAARAATANEVWEKSVRAEAEKSARLAAKAVVQEAAEAAAKEAATAAAKAAAAKTAEAVSSAAEAKAEAKAERQRIDSRLVKINHVAADEVAEKLNAMWNGEFGVNWKLTKIAVAFPESNAVLLTAPKPILEACQKAILALDVESPQVYIEARFVELGNTASHKVGIDWTGIAGGTTISGSLGGGFQTTTLGDGVKEYNRTIINGKNTESYSLSAGSTTTYASDGKTIASVTRGSDDGKISYFNGTLNISQMALTLSALDSTADAKTFSNPKIIVSSGKKATVDMTTKYPNVKISTKRTTGTSDSVDIASNLEAIPGEDKFMFAKEAFFSWGISLEVTPRIGTNGLINVSIVPTISSLDSWVETGTTGDEDDGGTVSTKYPVIKVQRLISEFNLQSGTTAVIGGLSITEENQVDNGIPLLREIPWIGPRLFGSKTREKSQKEIIVFVTVGLVDPRAIRADAGLPKNAVLGRQYTEGQKLEPGDRPAKNMEGYDSLDLRPLEEQALDPLQKNEKSTLFGLGGIPFTRDPDYSNKEEQK